MEGTRLYIMTLCVLSPYRRLHIGLWASNFIVQFFPHSRGALGHALLEQMLEVAKKDPAITEVFLHVQTNNDCAIRFYSSFGFTKEAEIRNYYRNIEPPNCYVLALDLAELRQKETNTTTTPAATTTAAAPAPDSH